MQRVIFNRNRRKRPKCTYSRQSVQFRFAAFFQFFNLNQLEKKKNSSSPKLSVYGRKSFSNERTDTGNRKSFCEQLEISPSTYRINRTHNVNGTHTCIYRTTLLYSENTGNNKNNFVRRRYMAYAGFALHRPPQSTVTIISLLFKHKILLKYAFARSVGIRFNSNDFF